MSTLRQSNTSFLCSLVLHVGLLLILSALFINSRGFNQIFLEADVASSEDLETEITLAIEIPTEIEYVNLDTADIESPLDDVLESDDNQLLEVSGLPYDNLQQLVALSEGTGDSMRAVPGGGDGFFGIEATGNRIVYVIDMSPSMAEGEYGRRYDRAVNEVLSSVDLLRPDQKFYVYLFSFKNVPMQFGPSGREFCPPTPQHKKQLETWLKSIQLRSGTDPRVSLVKALKQYPTCVFLLSDGEFNGVRYRSGKYGNKVTAVELAKRYNQSECPIHTIGLEDAANQADMTKIAEQSGGIYKFVPAQIGP
jgi:hypothetical protein